LLPGAEVGYVRAEAKHYGNFLSRACDVKRKYEMWFRPRISELT